jgi:hypothetical protein
MLLPPPHHPSFPRHLFPCQGVEAVLHATKEPWNLRQVDVVMYIDSPLSENLCFTLPILSYRNGVWKSVVEMVRSMHTRTRTRKHTCSPPSRVAQSWPERSGILAAALPHAPPTRLGVPPEGGGKLVRCACAASRAARRAYP